MSSLDSRSVSSSWIRRWIVASQAWLSNYSHHALAQRVAGAAFVIRVASAGLLYLTQIVLARWIGGYEFGIYVYVWTLVLLAGDILHLGLASAAQRLIPEYVQQGAYDRLRGFLVGSQWLVLTSATVVAMVGAAVIWLGESLLSHQEIIPLYFACLALPFYTLTNMLDGIARSYNWVNLALIPPYVLRPLVLLLVMTAAHVAGVAADAQTAMLAALVATWSAAIVQLLILNRRLAGKIPPVASSYEVGDWFSVALPILMVWGFYTLLTYADIIVLRQFRPPDEVALYYAAAKTVALVAFVHFAVGVAVAHRFSEYRVACDRDLLSSLVIHSIRWTFWPSLALVAAVLTLGPVLLKLFGVEFLAAYPLMFVLAIGVLARAAVGPAERLLSMLGEQITCAIVYVAVFAINIGACFILIPRFGVTGAAIATATALVIESVLLFLVARQRLAMHCFIWGAATMQSNSGGLIEVRRC